MHASIQQGASGALLLLSAYRTSSYHPDNPVTPLNGSEASPLDEVEAALLLGDLRRLWRAWQERARTTPVDSVANAYREAMVELEDIIEERDRRYRSWITLRNDVAQAVAERLT